MKDAYALKQDGPLEAAIQHYEQVLATDPTGYLACHQKGEIFASQNRHKEVIACYQKSIAINPQFPWSYNALGLLYLRTNNFEKSISTFKQAVVLKPTSALFKSRLGNAF